ncbi:MAG: efflux RND transporter periplasmic adaptor subunit [Gemmatimonadota bacterium]
MMRRHLIPGMALLLLASGCKQKAPDTAAATPADQGIQVGRENVVIVEPQKLTTGPALSGTLSAERTAQVRAEVAGAVTAMYVEQGQSVSRGALLARIDDTSIRDTYLSARSAMNSAQSSLDLAKRNAERSATLAKAGAIADRDLESARQTETSADATLADTRARLATAEKQLSKTEVRAPIGGIVSERPASAGDVLLVGGALLTIVDPSSMRFEASVPAERLATLKVGTPVDFSVSGYEKRTFSGRIERINPSVDPATRQVRLYVSIPNAGQPLVAGLFAEGRVATDSKTAIALPASAVDERGTSPTVLRLRASKVERVAVQLGVRDEIAERVEIRSGIQVGDTILVGTAQSVSEGATVRLVGEETSGKQ